MQQQNQIKFNQNFDFPSICGIGSVLCMLPQATIQFQIAPRHQNFLFIYSHNLHHSQKIIGLCCYVHINHPLSQLHLFLLVKIEKEEDIFYGNSATEYRSYHVAYYASKPWHCCCYQWGCSNKQVSLGTQYLSRDKLIQVFMKYWRTVSEACS